MKIGMRKINPKRIIKAKTVGKLKRSVKKTLIPGYGKKSAANLHPVRSLKQKVYRKTTFNIFDLFK